MEFTSKTLEAVYNALAPFEQEHRSFGSNLNFREQASSNTIKNLYLLSGNVEITAMLVWILHQKTVAERFVEAMSPEVFVAEAGEEAISEAEAYYEAAKGFCDEAIHFMEARKASVTFEVQAFLEEYLTSITTSWAIFRVRVNTVAMKDPQ